MKQNPASMDWVQGGAEGCFSKKLFIYGSAKLGQEGKAASYTTLYKFGPGARYPAWRVVDGAVEIEVRQGILDVNGQGVAAPLWVQLGEHPEGWSIGSKDGCEILAIVRGSIELVEGRS